MPADPKRPDSNSNLLGPPRTLRLAYWQEDAIDRIWRVRGVGVSKSTIIRELVAEALEARKRKPRL